MKTDLRTSSEETTPLLCVQYAATLPHRGSQNWDWCLKKKRDCILWIRI